MLRLYSSFIRSHLEYGIPAWDPFLKKDIDLTENVQKFVLKVCTKSWDGNYTSLLETTHLPSLQSRRTHAKLCNLFRIVNGLTFYPNAPTQVRQQPYPSRSVYSREFVPLQCHSLKVHSSQVQLLNMELTPTRHCFRSNYLIF